VLNKLFERKQVPGSHLNSPRFPRYSGGWALLRKRLEAESSLRVLDTGPINASNINYITDHGHSLFLSDLVHEAWSGEFATQSDEGQQWDVHSFLKQTMELRGHKFDLVLLWTALDYLPEALLQPVIDRLHEVMNPFGQVFALFHTRTTGDEAVHCRFHLTPTDEVLVQLGEPLPLQRSFTNRSVERLFSAWSGQKFFLAKDSLSEVIFTNLVEE